MHYKHINSIDAVRPLINSLIPGKNVSIIWETDKWAPRTSPGTTKNSVVVILPQPNVRWTQDIWASFWLAVYHECGHWQPETMDIWDVLKKENIDCTSLTGLVLNCLDDVRADFNRREEYVGKLEAVTKGNAVFWKQLIENKNSSLEPSDKRAILEGCLLADLVARDEVDNVSDNIRVAAWDKFHEKSREVAETLMNRPDIMSRWHSATAAEELELAKEIVSLFSYEEPVEEKEGEGGKEGEGEGEENESGSGQSDEGSDEEGDGKGTGDGEDEGESGKEDGGKEEKEDLSDLIRDNHEIRREYMQEKPSDLRASKTSLKIDYSSYMKRGTHTRLANDEEYQVVDVYDTNNQQLVRGAQPLHRFRTPSSGGKIPGYLRPTATEEAIKLETSITNRIRKILQVELRSRYLTNQRKGKLNGSSLHKVKTSKNKRPTIFKNKFDSKRDDCRISILVDNSGSMGGAKQNHAIMACHYLSALCDSLHVPYEVAFFTEDRRVLNFITKPYDKPRGGVDKLKEQEMFLKMNMSGNSDGDSVRLAYDRLLAFGKEKRKCLFVLSDGQPSSMRSVSEWDLLMSVVKTIESDPRVDIMGIGIMDSSVSHFYKDFIVLKRAHELEDTIINLVARTVLGKTFVGDK